MANTEMNYVDVGLRGRIYSKHVSNIDINSAWGGIYTTTNPHIQVDVNETDIENKKIFVNFVPDKGVAASNCMSILSQDYTDSYVHVLLIRGTATSSSQKTSGTVYVIIYD